MSQLLHVACANGDVERIRALLDAGKIEGKIDTPINTTSKTTPLMLACTNGRTAAATFLIECGADVHLLNDRGETALYHAAVDGRLECVKLLIQHGAQVNHVDNDGASPLHRATQSGHKDVMQALIKEGADKNAVFFNNTPLQWSALCHHEECESYLRKLGAKAHPQVNSETGEVEYGILTHREKEKFRRLEGEA